MPEENEADHILRERMRQRAEQEQEALDKAKHQRDSDLERYAHELEAEIPIVLRLLAEYKDPYQGMKEVHFTERKPILGGLFGYREPYRVKAGWQIGQSDDVGYNRYHEEFRRSMPIYLLSDGRIGWGPFARQTGEKYFTTDNYSLTVRLPQELKLHDSRNDKANVTYDTLSAIRELRRKLEDGSF
jgi:hypothetical protein